jgi:hypothetical protein
LRASSSWFFLSLLVASNAQAKDTKQLTADEKKVIGQRLAPAVNYTKELTLEEGGTIFVVRHISADPRRIRLAAADYEGLVTGVTAPKGVVVDERIDEVKLGGGGAKLEVILRYAIHADQGAQSGALKAQLKLLERVGISAAVSLAEGVDHKITITPAAPGKGDLAADFWGYRVYKELATTRVKELAGRGVPGLTLKDGEKLPMLDRLDGRTAVSVFEFERWRRRIAVARRHLVAASKLQNAELAQLAEKYLAKLDAEDSELADLPDVPIAVAAAAPAAGGAGAGAGGAAAEETPKSAEKKQKGGVIQLVPLEADSTKKESEPTKPPEDERREPAKAPVQSTATANPPPEPEAKVVESVTRREEPIPNYPRSLVLDDPNIGYDFAIRGSYLSITTPESAASPSMFIATQTSITRDVGIELTLPISYVSLTSVPRSVPLLSIGNPLLAAKYRLYLPEIAGRAPVLALRARWGIPLFPDQDIRPTRFDVESFSRDPHFDEEYAFTHDKHDVGAGFSAAWQQNIFHVAAQMYLDYFGAVPKAPDSTNFLTLSYGASFGVRPVGDLLGIYAELRGTSLLTKERTEIFGYVGARAHLAEFFEPAVWIGLPFGSVGSVSTLQIGGELRFAYDVEAVIERGTIHRDELNPFDQEAL